MNLRRGQRWRPAVVGACLMLLAMLRGGAAAEPAGTLRVAVASFAFETTLPQEGSVANHLYWDPLYDYMFYDDDKGGVQSGLISAWKSSSDGLTWTFTARQGVTWHNGRPLDAEDICFNFKYWILSPRSKHNTSAILLRNVISCDVTGPSEATVKLKHPQALFLNWLSDGASTVVVPREYGTMSDKQAREHPIGTGAWKFVSRSLGEDIRFEANPNHWRQTPHFKNLVLKLVPEASTRLAMLKRGEVDIIDVPLSFKKEIQGLPLTVIRATDAFSSYLFFSGMYQRTAPGYDAKLPWRDLRVRKALNLAIDRQAIADHVFQGEARPAAVIQPLPAQLGFKPSWTPYAYAPDEAKQLLAQAGYANGFAINLMSYPRPGVPDIPLMVEAIADYWRRIGVTAKIVKTEWDVIRPRVQSQQAKDFAAPITQGMGVPDIITVVLGSQLHFFSMSDRVNQAIDAVQAAGDTDAAAGTLGLLGDAMIAEYAVVPVALLNQLYVMNPKTVADWPVRAHQGGPNRFAYATQP
jgi:peptide/nickel transport system substrate-binding protein